MFGERTVLDELSTDEPCLGAVFCTYTFDPRFFEEHVLRVLLNLRSDPEEQASIFHDEARRSLQETPVAVIVDASVRQAGRRLPYDLLLVRRRTFHPKLVLAIYAEHALLLIGSCNLTRGGYSENLELVFTRSLSYSDPADATTLRAIDRFLASTTDLTDARGTQLGLVRDELARRLPPPADPALSDHALLSSFDRPILDQLFDLVPSDVRITDIGVLAPFYERDDADAAIDGELDSFLAQLAEHWRTDGLVLDLATGWDDSPIQPPSASPDRLTDGLGSLWAWRYKPEASEDAPDVVTYVVPTSIGERTLSLRDAYGNGRREPIEVVDEALEQRKLWKLEQPTLHLPAHTIERLRTKYDLHLWVQPGVRLDAKGRISRRTLHAKLVILNGKRRGKELTWILMGSPNASRAAMLRSVQDGGNVELAVLAALEGRHTITELLPSVVTFDPGLATLVEREIEDLPPDLGAWIEDAVHGPTARSLTIVWASEGPAPLGPWTLAYEGRTLATGDGPSSNPTPIADFDLLPSSAELELRTADRAFSVPIRVSDLAELPTHTILAQLELRELLALLGRRVGVERLAHLKNQRGDTGVDTLLESIFGEGFGPVDVFKAWWGIAQDLQDPISVAAFRHRVRGPLGVLLVWDRLRAEADQLGRDEVWIYGCELVRTLRAIALPEGADQPAKKALLDETCAAITATLDAFQPPPSRPWIDAVVRFYRGAPANA